MSIHKLPQYLTQRFVIGEIIERPASVVKELVENSLDAWAMRIQIDIRDGGKSLVSVEDDGSWIELSDMDFLFQNYSSSKIHGEQDIFNLTTYGFRGEALAHIAQLAKTTVISKTAYSEIGTKITKLGLDPIIKHQPVGFEHGTIVTVENLFHAMPDRLNSLKSSQTEFFYCYNYIVDIALIHYDKTFIFKKNDKTIFDLQPKNSLLERMTDIHKKNWSEKIKHLNYDDEEISLRGILGDTSLSFGSMENIKIYVNKRPVQEQTITKAVMDAYHKTISGNEYPLAIIIITTKANSIELNKDPKKMDITFSDSKKIYDRVYHQIQSCLSGKTDISISLNAPSKEQHISDTYTQPSKIISSFVQTSIDQQHMGEYFVIGQARKTYIVLQSPDSIYYVDQYDLAKKILFEKIKKSLSQTSTSEILLQPIILNVVDILHLDSKLDQLTALWFDVSMIGENKLAIYSLPQVFSIYKIDMEKMFHHILYLDTITFDHILESIFATHACKVSIKAGDRLSLPEMIDLIKEGFTLIPDLVYQKNGALFVKQPKDDIDKFFDR